MRHQRTGNGGTTNETYIMDLDEQLAIWKLCLSRIRWERARMESDATGDNAGVEAAEQALAHLPEVGPLDGLRANAELVSRLSAQRFIAMRVAQQQGASSEQIGAALGVSRQSAWEFMKRKIAEHPLQEAASEPGDPRPADRE
jgi:hypothetical protein